MAAIINGEKYGTRILSGDRAERLYLITNTTSDLEARTALIATAPTSITNGMKTLYIDYDSLEVIELEDEIWEGRVLYQTSGATENNNISINYDISTTRFNRRFSYQTVSQTVKQGEDTRNFGQAINVTNDTIDGVEYEVPVMTGSVTKKFTSGQVNDAWIGNLYHTVGTVNAGYFRGLQAGEGLLIAVNGSTDDEGDWDFTFTWAISPNETNLVVSPDITVASKRGWDYLWVSYAKVDDAIAGPLPVAKQANVERIYRYTNWNVLGI